MEPGREGGSWLVANKNGRISARDENLEFSKMPVLCLFSIEFLYFFVEINIHLLKL